MKVIDLSKPLFSDMAVYPGDPEVNIERIHSHEEAGWELRRLTMGTHSGTHVDAFSHMHKGKASIDEIAIERFLGEAQVVYLEEEWPSRIGLFFTEKIGIEKLQQLIDAKPTFVGGELTEELERVLLGRDIITYTDLVRLEELPKHTSFTFYGLPLNIQDGDGSPVRAIAILKD